MKIVTVRRRSLAARLFRFPALMFFHYTILRKSGVSRGRALHAGWSLASCVLL
jgi:hypothetical protein